MVASGARPGLARRDVLVKTKEVVRIVFALERLQAVVLRSSVRLADALFAFLHEEVHVHAGVVRLEGRPIGPNPLTFGLPSFRGFAVAVDVEGEAGASPMEGGLVVADVTDRAAQLPDPAGRSRRRDL